MSVLGLSYGTVESGKAEAVYMSAIVLAKRYNVNYLLVRPDNIYPEDNLIVFNGKKYYSKYAYTFTQFFKNVKRRESYIIHVQHFHLFSMEELEYLTKFLMKTDSLVRFLGLKYDYKADIYEQWSFLSKVCDFSEELESYCTVCGQRAKYSQGIIEEEPVPYIDNQKILLSLHYEPRCENCYVHPREVSEDIAFRSFLFFSNREG